MNRSLFKGFVRPVTALALLALLLAQTNPARAADEGLDDIIDRLRQDDIKAVGLIALVFSYPAEADHAREQLRRNWWAFQPGVKLTPEQLHVAEVEFQKVGDGLRDLMQSRSVKDLKFAGVDRLGLSTLQDWYFIAAAPEGPILLRVSVGYVENARVFGIRWYTTWDEIKHVLANVQYKLGKAVLTISYTPRKDREAGGPATRPE